MERAGAVTASNAGSPPPRLRLEEAVVPHLQVPLPVALAKIERLTRDMAEAEIMCSHVALRLRAIHHALQTAEMSALAQTEEQAMDKFLWQTFRFHNFLTKFAHKRLITRLVCSRKIVEQTRSVHCELDAVAERLQGVCSADPTEDWEPQWREDRRLLRLGWQGLRQDRSLLAAELLDTSSQIEAMVLLRCEKESYFSKYSTDELELLNVVFGYVANLSHAEVPHVPNWFIPPHEMDVAPESFTRGAFGSVHHGTWLGAHVAVKRLLNPVNDEHARKDLMNEIHIWSQLSHPYVVKLHGACHVGQPFFVCEFASRGILPDYLAKEEREGRHVTWQKLYEVGLGLHYLHRCNVTHGDLKGNNILVGADGAAKLTDFGLSAVLSSSMQPAPPKAVGALRWKAPEILDGSSTPSHAADMYSFGMSIIEAVTHTLPWGNQLPDKAVRYHVVIKRALPDKPEAMTNEQWELVQQMCAFEPGQRPNTSAVLEKLKQFADTEFNEGSSHVGFSASSQVANSVRSMNSHTTSSTSIRLTASPTQSQGERMGSTGTASSGSARTLSSSNCSNITVSSNDAVATLDLHEVKKSLTICSALVGKRLCCI
ncbi:hypothetical protein BBJ28_00019752 [Nothophytophthora sp. Chile5]|nr:hypothetical protein BBJ28_00019752 [Nothophytophthora sp. Chile5]